MKRKKKNQSVQKVSKAAMAVSADSLVNQPINTPNLRTFVNNANNKRPYDIYFFSELTGVAGVGTDGKMHTGMIERPLFGLSIEDREDIFKRSDVILGITTNRMNRMAGLDWTIEHETDQEDKIVTKLKMHQEHFKEFGDTGIKDLMIRAMSLKEIRKILNDIKNDMSNFDTALLRWSKRIKQRRKESCQQVIDWLAEPNLDDTFSQYLKKWVHDMMIHGAGAEFQEYDSDHRLDNFYLLPGGSCIPLKSKFIGGGKAYIQMVQGQDGKIFYSNEISMTNYIPVSGWASAFVPLEALVNKIAEGLLFDQLMAERADGTAPPAKAVIFGQRFGFGGLDEQEGYDVPLPVAEQKRIETQLNEPRKNAIRTLTGVGQPLVLDLSKSDTIQYNMERQKDILRNCALVFNMTPLEVNLTGGQDTSGRNTSESQEQREKEEGIYPLAKTKEEQINTEIVPRRFGHGFSFKFKTAMSEEEELKLMKLKIDTGVWSVNRILIENGDTPYDKPEFNYPKQASTPDGSEANPLNTRAMNE